MNSARLFLTLALTTGILQPGSVQKPPATQQKLRGQSEKPKKNNPKVEDPTRAVLAAFDKYAVVGLDAAHGNKDLDDFILHLVRDPAFANKVNDIAVECGNSLYQPVLDRYIAGEDVPLSEVRPVWRDSQTMCSVSGFYEILFPLVRRINQKASPNKKIRVLAGDPPVDWSKVKSSSDLEGLRDRDSSIAAVMEKEVLSKRRKALMLFGTFHLFHTDTIGAVGQESAVELYEKTYPGLTFVIGTVMVFDNSTPPPAAGELEVRMASWPVPSLVENIQGTWLEEVDKFYFSKMVDAYLYLGPSDLLLVEPRPAEIFSNKEYMAELRRRAAIIADPLVTDQANPDKLSDADFEPFLYRSNDARQTAQSQDLGPSPGAVSPNEALRPRTVEIPQAISLSLEVLKSFAGKYAPESPSGDIVPVIEIIADNDGLWVDLGVGTGKRKFVAISPVEFMQKDVPATRVTFQQNQKGETVGLIFKGLWTSEATRLPRA